MLLCKVLLDTIGKKDLPPITFLDFSRMEFQHVEILSVMNTYL